MAMRPVVDGIESELQGRLRVLRLDVQDREAAELMQRFEVRYTPTFVLLDGQGALLLRTVGALDPQALRAALSGP